MVAAAMSLRAECRSAFDLERGQLCELVVSVMPESLLLQLPWLLMPGRRFFILHGCRSHVAGAAWLRQPCSSVRRWRGGRDGSSFRGACRSAGTKSKAGPTPRPTTSRPRCAAADDAPTLSPTPDPEITLAPRRGRTEPGRCHIDPVRTGTMSHRAGRLGGAARVADPKRRRSESGVPRQPRKTRPWQRPGP
jgi:hypothetical protein